MTSLFYVHWWGVLSGVGVPCAGRLASLEVLSVGDVPKSGGLASLRSATVGGEPVRDLLPTLSVR